MAAAFAICGALSACGLPQDDVALLNGPPITDIVTRFDEALYCLNGRIDGRLSFAVGGIPDQTGREQNSSEGTGRFVTQGAGDIVQSALFNAGVTVINRRDMGTAAMEAQWGIRDLSGHRTADLVITGSINSLDFLPGGGAYATVAGVGPRYLQNRILVGMDLAITNNSSGQIVANIALRKQLVADELGFMFARAVDDNLIDVDFGGSRREALHFALREMLQLATFELLTQLMPPVQYEDCRAIVDDTMAMIEGNRTSGGQMRQFEAAREAEAAAAAAAAAAAEAASAPVVVEESAAAAPAAAPAQAEPAQAVAEAAPAASAPAADQAAQVAEAPAPTPTLTARQIIEGTEGVGTDNEQVAALILQRQAAEAEAPAQVAATTVSRGGVTSLLRPRVRPARTMSPSSILDDLRADADTPYASPLLQASASGMNATPAGAD